MMSLKECYDSFGGGYEDVKERIPNDALIQRLALKFLADPSFERLCKALEADDYAEGFRAAHTLKGVSQNLGFQRLGEASSRLTELLRGSEEKQINPAECDTLWQQVTKEYEAVVEALRSLADA